RSEPTTRTVVLRNRLQNTAWARGSNWLRPNRAWGRSQWMPKGPSAMIAATIGDDEAKDGMKLDQSQMRNPTETAAIAAFAEASRQNRAAMIAGRNWATPVKEISPIGARASEARVR